jgi:hypothetical protein
MLRGDLSNEPEATILVDYRVLIDQARHYRWFEVFLPRLLLEIGFESKLKALLPIREGAVEWLGRNWHRNIEVFSTNVPLLMAGIDDVLLPHVALIRHFADVNELRFWLLTNTQVIKVYTTDRSLLGLNEMYQLFSGWSERA